MNENSFDFCFRILHILSPVKWSGDIYNAQADSNFKVCLKTINNLPTCHHYVIVPLEHNFINDNPNVTLIRYNYPKSVLLNRGTFDYRQIRLDFANIDVDFVFTHQPELIFNIHLWFHSKRYFEDVSYFGFYHWIDCKHSRGSVSGSPSFYMKQLESMHNLDYNFVHSQSSVDYLLSNFNGMGVSVSPLLSKISFMPLSSDVSCEPTPFDLPQDKKVLLFNHRWNESSGIKRLISYLDSLPNEYLVWVTDESCDYKHPKLIAKHLKYSDYVYLLKNCHASICFIDGYCTWNLSAQDSILMGRPLLYYSHQVISNVVSPNGAGSFSTFSEFNKMLNDLPFQDKAYLKNHDDIFISNLKSAMLTQWFDTKKPPTRTEQWKELIDKGVGLKKAIMNSVYGEGCSNSSAHWIRRHLLNNGYKDNINNPNTEYYCEGKAKKVELNLFSSVGL
jgi:hypothetical protein